MASARPHASTDAELERFLERVRPPAWSNPLPKASYDWVVLGAGPAGLSAARTAQSLGLSVALVERHRLGGVSLNVGSVPSKAIVRTGRAFEALINSQDFGAPACEDSFADMTCALGRMRRLRTRIAEYCSAERLTAAGIDVFFCDARFLGSQCILAGSAQLRFKKALIATGARPRLCDIPGLREAGYLTNVTIFEIDALPRRLAIVGGGPLGCEMAQAFAHMGSRVTILQNEPKFLPREERDAAEILSRSLSRSGVDTRLNTSVIGARTHANEKLIRASREGLEYELAVDEILLSVGRSANTEELRIEAAGVEYRAEGGIQVDDFLRTANPNVYAAGDVCMDRKFTNIAEATGRMAVLNGFYGDELRCSQMIVPWCTYCDPEIAHIGMQIWDAKRLSIPVKSYTVMMQDVDRAITDGRDDGFVKIHIREGTDEIIGATIVASRASEMINEISVIMSAKIGMRRLATIVHTYPTQSDAIRLAAIAYLNSIADSRA